MANVSGIAVAVASLVSVPGFGDLILDLRPSLALCSHIVQSCTYRYMNDENTSSPSPPPPPPQCWLLQDKLACRTQELWVDANGVRGNVNVQSM